MYNSSFSDNINFSSSSETENARKANFNGYLKNILSNFGLSIFKDVKPTKNHAQGETDYNQQNYCCEETQNVESSKDNIKYKMTFDESGKNWEANYKSREKNSLPSKKRVSSDFGKESIYKEDERLGFETDAKQTETSQIKVLRNYQAGYCTSNKVVKDSHQVAQSSRSYQSTAFPKLSNGKLSFHKTIIQLA